MEQKINIAELLKDCPKGMELDSPMFENLVFDRLEENNGADNIICLVKTEFGYTMYAFTKYGCYSSEKHYKCVIFPKGKTTWEGFVPPCKFKDGDVVFTTLGNIAIISNKIDNKSYHTYCGLFGFDAFAVNVNVCPERFATKEEKAKLFQAIKDNGYKWNAETRTLEKLVKPRFKVGDKVKRKDVNYTYIITIAKLDGDYYDYVNEDGQCGVIYISKQDDWELAPNIKPKFKVGDRVKDKNNRIWFVVHISEKHFDISRVPNAEGEGSGYFVPIEDQDEYELVPNKFDITTLKPFDKVLVRVCDTAKWIGDFYMWHDDTEKDFPYNCVGGIWSQCIPYEGNQHILGTTNDCDDYYKIWE